MDGSVWWEGKHQALLVYPNIRASWVYDAGYQKRIAIANRAFQLYYKGMQCVNHPSVGFKQKKAMKDRLHSLAKTGWGSGVSNLGEAFLHLAENGTVWKDDNTADYTGGSSKAYAESVQKAPEFAVTFLKAVESDYLKFKKTVLTGFSENLSTLALLANQRTTDWERVNKTLGAINTGASNALPFLWNAPPMQKAMWAKGRPLAHGGSLGKWDRKLSGIGGRLVTFTKVWGYVTDGITDYVKFGRHGLEGFAPLKFALKFVPILGDFYGRAIDAIPNLKKWFTGMMQQYIRRIDRLSTDFELKKNLRRRRARAIR